MKIEEFTMRLKQCEISLLSVLFTTLLISGCTTFQIIDLNPHTPEYAYNGGRIIDQIVGVQQLNVALSQEYVDADSWQQGLAEALRSENNFANVIYPYQKKEDVNIVIRGNVSGNFRHHGAKNFFTWWPGGLIFAPNWRGTRYIYEARAEVEVVDAQSGKVLERHHAETSHELIHKSSNPGPFFGALILFPGIVKGSLSVSPRAKYRKLMYEEAYSSLWDTLSKSIIASESKRYSQYLKSVQQLCGERLNKEPVQGTKWSEFVSCQTQKYILLGREPSKEGTVSVYLSKNRLLRVHVINGNIVRWFRLKKRWIMDNPER
jgi:hypothetical protein